MSQNMQPHPVPQSIRRVQKHKHVVIALSTLLAVMLTSSTCLALGILPWKLAIHWNADHFKIDLTNNSPSYTTQIREFKPTGLNDELDTALEAHNFLIALPTWIPEEFAFEDLEVDVVENFDTSIIAWFKSQDSTMSIHITRFDFGPDSVSTTHIEKDDTPVEIVKKNGIDHHIYSNLSRRGVFWYEEPYSVIITGHLSVGNIKKMIESIYD